MTLVGCSLQQLNAMDELTKHFDPLALVQPKTHEDHMAMLRELNAEIDILIENFSAIGVPVRKFDWGNLNEP